MKKIYIKFFSIVMALIAFVGCEDDEKNPLFVNEDFDNFGVFVTLEQETLVIDFTNPETTYDFVIDSPVENVTEYQIELTRETAGVLSDTVSVTTVSSLPASFSYTAEELASFLGLTSDDLAAGDRFDFIGTAVGVDGELSTFQNLNGDATGPGQFQGFNHTTFLSCPFNADEIAGTYEVQEGGEAGIYTAGDTFEVIPGPGPEQYSIVNAGDIDLIINVDVGTGISIPSDDVFLTLASGLELVPAPANAGFTFSCTGTIFLTGFEYSCCGAFPLIMSKI